MTSEEIENLWKQLVFSKYHLRYLFYEVDLDGDYNS